MATKKDKKTESKKEESKREEAQEYAEAYADSEDITVNEAMARLAVVGWKRMKALKKDNARREKGLKPQHRKVTVVSLAPKKDKPAKAKKAKKAKKVKRAPKPVASASVNGAAHATA